MKLLNYLKDINIYLLILDILFLVISFLFFAKKKSTQRVKDLFIILYTLINIFLFDYLNNLFNNIFNYSDFSIKIYLIGIILVYIIFFYTFNKKSIKKIYKVINYSLFIITNISLIINIYIILTIKIDKIPKFNIENNSILNNITLIIIVSYLINISFIYIINTLVTRKVKNKEQSQENILDNEYNQPDETNVLTTEELLKYNKNNSLYINGVDCSIIFNDSNEDNIIKNYQILTNNIEDKMVNGYTLNENIMLKRICEKLNTNNLFEVNIDNFNILNKISE